MTENQKKILEMLAEKKITTDEAYRLLNAIDSRQGQADSSRAEPQPGPAPGSEPRPVNKPRYLRVTIQPSPNSPESGQYDRVNIRVPMSLIRAGMKMTSLIPPHAYDKVNDALKEKGIDFDVRSVKPEDLDDLVEALGDMQIDIEGGKHGERVKVYAE
jgi:hypothetical protein